jgi:(p)ppGpp synthase/HD superfamily hydrolase
MSDKDIENAKLIASKYHQFQTYGDSEPYFTHLEDVAKTVSKFGNVAVIIAYLHDSIEDTDIKKEFIKQEFGEYILTSIELLSDEEGENRKEKKRLVNLKLSNITDKFQETLIVKAGDRLSNIRASLKNGNHKKLKMYKKEHNDFKKAAFREGLADDIWKEVECLIKKTL